MAGPSGYRGCHGGIEGEIKWKVHVNNAEDLINGGGNFASIVSANYYQFVKDIYNPGLRLASSGVFP